MVETDERRRAAAKCVDCNTIGIVHVWPDGTQQPLGQSAFCECDEPALRVLEDGADGEDRP